ncbi:MAG: MerR family transcriptional regulator [Oscillospiraceae bacterium]|jgi:DNA-binding transcriptional MerR regulator|nr:MerR family transcriptional regulator [Oscillospiraceae bacterium]
MKQQGRKQIEESAEQTMLSIKDFADVTDTKQSTLRYYDSIGLFTPASRGKGNDYRYYSPEQIITVNLVNTLSKFNVPLKQISELMQDRSPQRIDGLLFQQELRLDKELRQLQDSYAAIHTLRKMIHTGLSSKEDEISVQEMEEMQLIMGPENNFVGGETFYRPFLRFCKSAKRLRVNMALPIGGYFESARDFLRFPSQPSRFFSLDPNGAESKAAGRYLVGYTRGSYGQMNDLPQRMQDFAKTERLRLRGPVYCIYVHDEICVPKADEYLVQVSIALEDTDGAGKRRHTPDEE